VQVQVLQGVSLDIRAGESIALVGSSGSGKSSVIKLVERLYPPTGGEILLDGRPLAEYDDGWLKRHMGLVGQECVVALHVLCSGSADGTCRQLRQQARGPGGPRVLGRLFAWADVLRLHVELACMPYAAAFCSRAKATYMLLKVCTCSAGNSRACLQAKPVRADYTRQHHPWPGGGRRLPRRADARAGALPVHFLQQQCCDEMRPPLQPCISCS
jgi:ABC-type oligopeptide transport system ATPase subunit